MAENKTKYDPSKLFVGTKLYKDEGSEGIILDQNGDWKSGKVAIELYDVKDGFLVSKVELPVSRAKYVAWKEDFDVLTTEQVIDEYFKDVKTTDPSETELQRESRLSKAESDLKAKDLEIEALKEQLKAKPVDDFVGEVTDLGDKEEPKKDDSKKK